MITYTCHIYIYIYRLYHDVHRVFSRATLRTRGEFNFILYIIEHYIEDYII